MAKVLEELQFKVDQLTFRLEEQGKQHAEAVARLKEEAKQIKKSLVATLEQGRVKVAKAEEVNRMDDAIIRKLEWRIDNFSSLTATPKNEAVWSSEFSVMGIPGLQLEFFPQGRESTKLEGFCALFLWCPVGVSIRYRMRVGNHWTGPEQDEYDSRMGHGHSNFCLLAPQVDQKTDSVSIGLEIMSLFYKQDEVLGVRMLNAGPEAMVRRETEVLSNRQMDCVEWRIKNIAKRIKEVPRGTAMCSPLFSIAGVREMLLEFYPNGIQPPPGAKEGREGYCGFYVRASKGSSRAALRLHLTLFVGGARKGPIDTEFDGSAAKGLPEFCKLEEQIDGEDLVVGVKVNNPELQQEVRTLVL